MHAGGVGLCDQYSLSATGSARYLTSMKSCIAIVGQPLDALDRTLEHPIDEHALLAKDSVTPSQASACYAGASIVFGQRFGTCDLVLVPGGNRRLGIGAQPLGLALCGQQHLVGLVLGIAIDALEYVSECHGAA